MGGDAQQIMSFDDSRLKTAPVKVARAAGDITIVSDGLCHGTWPRRFAVESARYRIADKAVAAPETSRQPLISSVDMVGIAKN